ncbi:NAD-dependent succinate-semialdehyde dehydrogenase [Halioxenophilus sp. WMMB6]|uniref:NAD-dependent succinate-semialdehyde dehydrogenase n=1 Tax=Halioxenophilus sp. WMMB6 TaxID=3073815 RepID=UPI00295F0A1D|nr:NAD-dependent succinate-semialdehyde dehydrogenase [Halioxenophilus sp. WMMB6]
MVQLKESMALAASWVGGRAVAGGDRFEVINPATGEPVATLEAIAPEQVAGAISTAVDAQIEWQQRSLPGRAEILLAWADLLQQHREPLAKLITAESGKLLTQAGWEIDHCAAMLRWYSQAALRITGTTLPMHGGQRNFTLKQPVGVVACITPWNFPAAAIIVKAGAALAAGCSCLIKPSELTPTIALALVQLAERAGVEVGVLNVLITNAPATVGVVLCADPRVHMVSFTGSTKVGKQLYQQCAATVKRLALEMGGNAPFIVFADADIERAVECAINARFYNSGQICVGANRFYIESTIYDQFCQRLQAAVASMSVGDPLLATSDIGPQIHSSAASRLAELVADAIDKGARLLLGEQSTSGAFFQPTVLADMQPTMLAFSAEIFGPVACLYRFDSEEEVITSANSTEAGLAAYLFTENISRLVRVSEQLQAGAIGANSCQLFAAEIPFGGWKQSGLGKEQGIDCLDEFLQVKSVCLGIE